MLELFLFDVIPRRNTNNTAHLLINRFGSLYGVFTAPYSELVKVEGVGGKTAQYIIDSYADFCRSTEREFKSEPLCSFESASNYLLWRKCTACDSPYVVIMLDCDMYMCGVYSSDAPDISSLVSEMEGLGAASVIIGVKPGFDADVIHGIEAVNVKIIDVIMTDGFNAESVAER